MCASIVSASASNWVDRGEPAGPTLSRILSHFLNQSSPEASTAIEDHATIVIGMVEADATEVHLVGYLRGVRRELGLPEAEPHDMRAVAIALWHVAKVAQVREQALRLERASAGAEPVAPRRLGEWLADRLLNAQERAQHQQARDNSPST